MATAVSLPVASAAGAHTPTIVTKLARPVRWLANIALTLGVAVAMYVLAMFAAGWMVPRLMTTVASGIGIDLSAATTAGFGVWLISSSVLALLVTAAVIWAARALWAWRGRVLAKLAARLERA